MCADVAFSFFGIHLWSKEASRRVSVCSADWDTCLVTLDGLSLGYRYLLGYHLGRDESDAWRQQADAGVCWQGACILQVESTPHHTCAGCNPHHQQYTKKAELAMSGIHTHGDCTRGFRYLTEQLCKPGYVFPYPGLRRPYRSVSH